MSDPTITTNCASCGAEPGEYCRPECPMDGFKKPHSTDANVVAAVALLEQRAAKGFAEYGVTTERTDLSMIDWLDHLAEELADALVYNRRIRKMLEERDG